MNPGADPPTAFHHSTMSSPAQILHPGQFEVRSRTKQGFGLKAEVGWLAVMAQNNLMQAMKTVTADVRS
jgi:hypothetical protein